MKLSEKHAPLNVCVIFGFFMRDSIHAKLNSHYEAESYKKKNEHFKGKQESCLERT